MTESETDVPCGACGAIMPAGHQYCGQCGAELEPNPKESKHWLIRLLSPEGDIEATAPLMAGTQLLGSGEDADIRLEGDRAVSQRHVLLRLHDGDLSLEDEGTRNGIFRPLTEPHALAHNDLIRAGGQLFRFQLIERLGREPVVPMPHPSFGPSRSAWGRLLRYNRHGQVSTSRLLEQPAFSLGRRSGDWVLKKARTLSGLHLEVKRDEDGLVLVHDLDSRNGTYIEVRGATHAQDGDRFLVGDRLIQVNRVPLEEYHTHIDAGEQVEIDEAQALELSEIGSEETLQAIPADIVEAVVEESVPPIAATQAISEADQPTHEVQPAVAQAPEGQAPEHPFDADEAPPNTDDLDTELLPSDAAPVTEAPEDEPLESQTSAEPSEASEVPEPMDEDLDTEVVQPAASEPEAPIPDPEDDDEEAGDWASAALEDFHNTIP